MHSSEGPAGKIMAIHTIQYLQPQIGNGVPLRRDHTRRVTVTSESTFGTYQTNRHHHNLSLRMTTRSKSGTLWINGNELFSPIGHRVVVIFLLLEGQCCWFRQSVQTLQHGIVFVNRHPVPFPRFCCCFWHNDNDTFTSNLTILVFQPTGNTTFNG
jgi:hypothetical protein